MRQRSLFGSLRGEDGRSLARALVVLVLVSLFGSGLNAGAAAADGRTVICAAIASVDEGGTPGPDGHLLSDCCLAGVMPLGMALAALPPEAAAPDPVGPTAAALTPVATISAPGTGLPLARGPPRSA